ncbi:MAG: SurA N-terminal domain-containing protein [Gemmataceae bacterium]|nr:SurA N-terminal domain-containing protein [Gemmataceae bacterium]
MAFNPFATFRKYQKIWMAGVLLICMLTFVLCTGVGGDLSDWILAGFRPKGQVVLELDGRSVRMNELDDLKERRKTANEFMRKAAKYTMARMDEVLKPENFKKVEGNPKELEALRRVQALRLRLEEKARQPNFFGDSGFKFDDLVDFQVWLAEADRLGIELTDEAVLSLVQIELVLGNREFFDAQLYKSAHYDVRIHNSRLTEAALRQILRDEFRVLLAQRVLGQSTGRMALTPGQLWEFYKEKRLEYKVTLLPLFVEDFVANVNPPNEVDLSSFFEKYKANPDDPTSDKIGFAIPTRIKAAWLSADPNSEHFKKLSKLAVQLQTSPPLPGPQLASWQTLGASLAKTAAAEQVFEAIRNRYRMVGPMKNGAALTIASYLSDKDPAVAGAMLGAGARLDGGFAVLPSYFSVGMLRHQKEFNAAVAADLKKRLPIYASLALMGTAHQGLAIPGAWDHLPFSDYLPLPLIQNELLEIVERRQAHQWVERHMTALRKKLEDPSIKTSANLQRELNFYPKDQGLPIGDITGLGLELVETKGLYHKFDIQDAKELEPLMKAFVAYIDQINIYEGRNAAPETILRESDFWKMFFSDGGEHFAGTAKYQVKPWPPAVRIGPQRVQMARFAPRNQLDLEIAMRAEHAAAHETVTIDLFKDAQRPFLFWRTAEKEPLVPTKLDEVRDRVIAAWKFNRAREDIALNKEGREIGLQLAKSNTPVLTMSLELDKLKKDYNVKRELIPLGNAFEPLSPLVPVRQGGPGGGQRIYTDYQLPAGTIPNPRKDTAAQLLGLYDLKEPIQIGYDPLDKLNKALYDEVSKEKDPRGKFVQVLTNQPRTAFYVAAVRDKPAADRKDFLQAALQAVGHDQLFDRGQVEAAKKLRQDLMRQLRADHRLEIVNEEARKRFDDAG